MVAEAGSGYDYFNLWLKAEKYSVILVNTIPTAGNALSVVASLFFGTVADATGWRPEVAIFVSILVIVSNILLSIWHIGKGGLFFAFFLSYVSAAAQPVIIVRGNLLILQPMMSLTADIFLTGLGS